MTAHDVSMTMNAPPHAHAPVQDDASRMERAFEWLSCNFERQPSLAEAAAHAGLERISLPAPVPPPGGAESEEIHPVPDP